MNFNNIKTFSKKNVLFILIFCLAIFLRTYQLDIVPAGYMHDEIDLSFNAKAFILSGSDQSGNWKPYKLEQPITEAIMGELVPLINAPLLSFLSLNIFNSRLTTVIFSILSLLLIYFISQELFSNKQISLINIFIYTINPWSIMESRISTEVYFSFFFSLLAFYFILKMKVLAKADKQAQKWFYTAFSIISIFVSYFTYHGYKFVTPFFIGAISVWIYFYSSKRNRTKLLTPLLLIFIFITALLGFSYFNSDNLSERTDEIILFQSNYYQSLSNSERRISLAPSELEVIFSNRYIILIRDLIKGFVQVYSPTILFISGENSDFFLVRNHGYFYLYEIITMILGFYCLFKHKRNVWLLFVVLLILIPIPTIIHKGISIFFRSSLILPILIMISSYGVYQIIQSIKDLKFLKTKITLYALIVGIISINSLYFLYQYFYYYPLLSERFFNYSERILSQYLFFAKDENIIVITDTPYNLFRSTIYHQNLLTKNNILSIQEKLSGGANQANFYFDNIHFTRNCKDLSDDLDEIIIVDSLISEECKYSISQSYSKSKSLRIVSPEDSGEYFKIYNETICSPFSHGTYVYIDKLNNLRLESESKQSFCRRWLVN